MSSSPIIIGVAGPSGSGKSLLAHTIVNELGSSQVSVLSEDCYYKDLSGMPMSQRDQMNYDHPDAFDHQLLIDHLAKLRQGETIQVPRYDYATHSRLEQCTPMGEHTIIVLEGILLFTEPELRSLLDISIYVDTPLDICFIRRLERDVQERERSMESVIRQYQKTVRPMYIQFIEPSKRHADIIVPHGGKNRIAIELIKAKMTALLSLQATWPEEKI